MLFPFEEHMFFAILDIFYVFRRETSKRLGRLFCKCMTLTHICDGWLGRKYADLTCSLTHYGHAYHY